MLDGSGAAIPPIAADRRILVVGAQQDIAVATGYLNPYRALLADLVVVDDGRGRRRPRRARRRRSRALTRPGVPVVRAVLRPRPLGDVRGRQGRVLRHGPAAQHDRIAAHLEDVYGAEVAHVSGRLSDRAALRAELAHLDADVVVVEVKAAAIDVVAEEAARLGIPVVLAANDVVPLPGEADLDARDRTGSPSRRSRTRSVGV